jgi:aromatic ring-opening dioxygenase LigB subunit
MPPVGAAVLPHPPLLVPELAGAAAAELDPLRAACRQALSTIVAAADTIVVVGDGPVWGVPEASAPGSFRPYGAEVEVALPPLADLDLPGLPTPARLPDLPLSLAVAAHLLADHPPLPERLLAATVPASLGPGAAAAIGQVLADAGAPGERVGLVVMGDLSACRGERAPGGHRPGAATFDASVAEALRTGKPERLLDLDPAEATDLLVAGRVPLQVLAGALQDRPVGRGDVLYEDAPYGVGYLVAVLTSP